MGVIGPAPTKWELERPRWPHYSTVRRVIPGGWRGALILAGLTRHPQFEFPLEERIELAVRWSSEGQSAVAVADWLGVTPGTVRRYLAAIPCRQCGLPQVDHGAEACFRCREKSGSAWGPAFTREELLARLEEWIAAEGRPPKGRDWRPSDGGGAPPMGARVSKVASPDSGGQGVRVMDQRA